MNRLFVAAMIAAIVLSSTALVVALSDDERDWTEYLACLESAHPTASLRMTPVEWLEFEQRTDGAPDQAARFRGLDEENLKVLTLCEPWRPLKWDPALWPGHELP